MATYELIADFPGYRVGSDGSVWSRKVSAEWVQLKPQLRRGYPRVGLWKGPKMHWRSVHTLILLAFVGPCPDGMECAHRDNNRQNNDISNLRWDTPLGNQADSNHKRRRGSAHKDAKLNESDIPNVLQRVAAGESRRSVARSLGVSHTVINGVFKGVAWQHVERTPGCLKPGETTAGQRSLLDV